MRARPYVMRPSETGIKNLLTNNAPRKITGPLSGHLHVYVDALDETGYCGVSGVIYAENGRMLGFFSEEVSSYLIQEIKSVGQVTIIQELEMLALLVATNLWCPKWASHRFVACTGSEAVSHFEGKFLEDLVAQRHP